MFKEFEEITLLFRSLKPSPHPSPLFHEGAVTDLPLLTPSPPQLKQGGRVLSLSISFRLPTNTFKTHCLFSLLPLPPIYLLSPLSIETSPGTSFLLPFSEISPPFPSSNICSFFPPIAGFKAYPMQNFNFRLFLTLPTVLNSRQPFSSRMVGEGSVFLSQFPWKAPASPNVRFSSDLFYIPSQYRSPLFFQYDIGLPSRPVTTEESPENG